MNKSLLSTQLKVSVVGVSFCSFLLLSAMPLRAQPSGLNEPRTEKTKMCWLTIGPVLRGEMKVKFTGSSYSQTLGLDRLGNPNAYDDRTYDDGYVRRDSSQGGGINPNTTWNWGYNNNSTLDQYDPVAGTLAFHSQGVPRYSALAEGGNGGKDDMLGGGLRFQAGLSIKNNDRWSVDIVFSFQGIWSDGKYRENARLMDITDTYNVAGINSPAFNDLNHRGTYDGPFDPAATPPYTVIPNLPTRVYTPSALIPAAQSHISFNVDSGLYQLSLGPQIGLKASQRLRLIALPTVSLNIVDVDVRRSETFAYGGIVQSWSDHSDKTKVRVGLGITAGSNIDLGKGWYTGVFGGYEWVPDKTRINIGPNTVSLDASGWVAGAILGYQF
jgi:hypothetical protein